MVLRCWMEMQQHGQTMIVPKSTSMIQNVCRHRLLVTKFSMFWYQCIVIRLSISLIVWCSVSMKNTFIWLQITSRNAYSNKRSIHLTTYQNKATMTGMVPAKLVHIVRNHSKRGEVNSIFNTVVSPELPEVIRYVCPGWHDTIHRCIRKSSYKHWEGSEPPPPPPPPQKKKKKKKALVLYGVIFCQNPQSYYDVSWIIIYAIRNDFQRVLY